MGEKHRVEVMAVFAGCEQTNEINKVSVFIVKCCTPIHLNLSRKAAISVSQDYTTLKRTADSPTGTLEHELLRRLTCLLSLPAPALTWASNARTHQIWLGTNGATSRCIPLKEHLGRADDYSQARESMRLALKTPTHLK